jgi:hypothetical protein
MGDQPISADEGHDPTVEEHFRPTGTIFILVMFVAALILLWLSVYVILLSRGVTT